MGSLSTVLYPDVLRSIDAATFTGDYQPLGDALAQPARIIKFVNNSDVDVLVSWDGVTDHEILPANSFVLLDVSTNKQTTQQLDVQQGQQFYVKAASGTGTFYLSNYFGVT